MKSLVSMFLVGGFIILLMLSRRGRNGKKTMQLRSQLTGYAFEKYIEEVTRATLELGGTASQLDGYQLLPPMDSWQFPKYPGRTVILPPQTDLAQALKRFISANETFLREPDCWLGTWINPQTRCFYLDITTSCKDLSEARRLALGISEREGRRIVALYNSKRRETIYL